AVLGRGEGASRDADHPGDARVSLQQGHESEPEGAGRTGTFGLDRKSTRLNSSHSQISYAVFCLKKKKKSQPTPKNSKQQTPTEYGSLPSTCGDSQHANHTSQTHAHPSSSPAFITTYSPPLTSTR